MISYICAPAVFFAEVVRAVAAMLCCAVLGNERKKGRKEGGKDNGCFPLLLLRWATARRCACSASAAPSPSSTCSTRQTYCWVSVWPCLGLIGSPSCPVLHSNAAERTQDHPRALRQQRMQAASNQYMTINALIRFVRLCLCRISLCVHWFSASCQIELQNSRTLVTTASINASTNHELHYYRLSYLSKRGDGAKVPLEHVLVRLHFHSIPCDFVNLFHLRLCASTAQLPCV